MVARLQAAAASSQPVLLRVDFGGSPGVGAAHREDVEKLADVYAFAWWQIGHGDE
jgi:prolyl oligopeptidase